MGRAGADGITSLAATAFEAIISGGGILLAESASLFCFALMRMMSFRSSSIALFCTFLMVPPQWITLILNDGAFSTVDPFVPSAEISTGLEIKVALAQTSLAASREHLTIAVPVCVL